MSRINPNDFKIKDIDIANMNSIQIENVSIGRSSGRRFKINCGAKKSKEVLFRDIFKRVQKLAKNERNIENLKSIEICLGKLKQVEDDAITLYQTQSSIYKIRTWFHRLFSFDNHLQSINKLRSTTQNNLLGLDLTKNLNRLANLPTDKKDKGLANLVSFYLVGSNTGEALGTCGKITDQNKKDESLVLIGLDCLDKNDIAGAAIATALIGTQSSNLLSLLYEIKPNAARDPLLERIAKGYIEKDELYKAFFAASEICTNNQKRDPFLTKIAKKYLAQDDLVTALEVNSEINDSTIKEAFIKKIAENYFQKNELDNAFKTVKRLAGGGLIKDPILEKIRQRHFDNNDFAESLVVNKDISDSRTKEDFIVKVAETYFTKNNLVNALNTTRTLASGVRKDFLLVKIREAHFNQHDLTNALDANKDISNVIVNTVFIEQVARAYIEKDKLQEALLLSKNINLPTYIRDSLLGKMAKSYFGKNDLPNTLRAIESMARGSLGRSNLRINLAQAFLDKNDLQNALKATKLIVFQSNKDAMRLKIAQAYFDKDDLVSALETIRMISNGNTAKINLITKIEYRNSWVGYFFGI